MSYRISELTSPEAFESIYPLIRLLNPDMSHARFKELLAILLHHGYRCAVAYAQDDTMAGLCGFWIAPRFYGGKIIQPDNLIVDDAHRGAGLGTQLLHWIEALGRKEGCDMAVLDTYTHNVKSHKLYHREGYHILGYHFAKKL